MSTVTITLDNSANSDVNNPPGSKQWVGGSDHGLGILVDKVDGADVVTYTIDASLTFLLSWYYDSAWQSGANLVPLDGISFKDKDVYKLPKLKL